MALINLSRRRRPAPRDQVVARIQSFIETQKDAPSFDAETLTLTWVDGPSLEEFYDSALEGTNWEVRAKGVKGNEAVGDGVIFADRSLSIVARAIAVVRFAAAKSTPLNISDPKDQEFFNGLLRESVYDGKWQMAELMAKYLIELTEDPKTDEMLASKFVEVGYEKLWNRAFSEMS